MNKKVSSDERNVDAMLERKLGGVQAPNLSAEIAAGVTDWESAQPAKLHELHSRKRIWGIIAAAACVVIGLFLIVNRDNLGGKGNGVTANGGNDTHTPDNGSKEAVALGDGTADNGAASGVLSSVWKVGEQFSANRFFARDDLNGCERTVGAVRYQFSGDQGVSDAWFKQSEMLHFSVIGQLQSMALPLTDDLETCSMEACKKAESLSPPQPNDDMAIAFMRGDSAEPIQRFVYSSSQSDAVARRPFGALDWNVWRFTRLKQVKTSDGQSYWTEDPAIKSDLWTRLSQESTGNNETFRHF